MTADEAAYLEEMRRMLTGEYGKLPMRVPPRIRALMTRLFLADDFARQADAQRDQLANMGLTPP
jgi:hypothetical protein